MDELVLKGLAKWPNVPAVFGWLALDRRGNWLLRNEKIDNPLIADFIGRNYEHDESGRWFFQNGPQRVFVSLQYTPLVYRVTTSPGVGPVIRTHHGIDVPEVTGVWLDDRGALLLRSSLAVGVVHDADLGELVPSFGDSRGNAIADEELERLISTCDAKGDDRLHLTILGRRIEVARVDAADVARCFGFDPDPRPADQRAADARTQACR
jgi:hypothetical protein